MLNITGSINVFANKRDYKKGGKDLSFLRCNTTITTKNSDETFTKKIVDVRFNKELDKKVQESFDEEHYYTMTILEGWLSVETFTAKNGATMTSLYLFVNKANITAKHELKKKEEDKSLADMPF